MQDKRTTVAAWLTATAGGYEQPEHPVTVLSARVLLAGRAMLGDSREVFAARAGTDPDLVEAIEKGIYPAWDVPGPVLNPIADVLRPALGDWFWTAVACDLLLTNLLSGDDVTTGVAAEEALGDLTRRQLALTLLRWAISGPGGTVAPLLPAADRVQVRHRAAELAESHSSDAWVGQEILSVFGSAP